MPLPYPEANEEYKKYVPVNDLEEAITLRNAGMLYVLSPPYKHKSGQYRLNPLRLHRLKPFTRGDKGRWRFTWKPDWWYRRRYSFYVKLEQ